MEQIEKSLEDITRSEWIAFRWVEIPPSMGDEDERIFRTAGRRTADEAYQTMMEWDETAEEREIKPERGLLQ